MSDLALEGYLVRLATVGAETVVAPPGLAQQVLARRQQQRRRWMTGLTAVAVVAAGAGVAGARLAHSGPLFAVIEPSGSMQPTIEIGNSVHADRRLRAEHGDVVVARVSVDGV